MNERDGPRSASEMIGCGNNQVEIYTFEILSSVHSLQALTTRSSRRAAERGEGRHRRRACVRFFLLSRSDDPSLSVNLKLPWARTVSSCAVRQLSRVVM